MPDAAKISLTEGTAPATPSTGNIVVYAKTDHEVYAKGTDGIERGLGTSGTAFYATSSGNSGSSGSSTTAANAGSAAFASSSGNAGTAYYATSSGQSGTSVKATSAGESGSAGSATTAANAGSSSYASSAGNSGSASSATTAGQSGTSSYATTSGQAGTAAFATTASVCGTVGSNGALGTPSSGDLQNCTSLPILLGTNPAPPAAVSSFSGTISAASLTATFTQAADYNLCRIGSTIISNAQTRYVTKLLGSLQVTLDQTTTWAASSAITSIQSPQRVSGSSGTVIEFTAANGSTTVILTSDGSILFHRTVDGNVGIGTEPEVKLHVAGAGLAEGSNICANMMSYNTGALASGIGGAIGFGAKYTATDYTIMGEIGTVRENATSGNYDGSLVFRTRLTSGGMNDRVTIKSNGNVGIWTIAPIYTHDVNGAINSRVYYWCDDFDDEAAGVQLESSLNADFWTTAGTNYAAGNVTYLGGTGGTVKAMCANADNDSVTILGLTNVNVTQNPILEARIKIDTKETTGFYVGFASAAFADVNGAFPNDAFLVGINSDNGHTFGATQIVAASVDNGAAVDYDDMGVVIVSDTFIKIKIDLTDTEQPRVWINDTEVAAGNITGTVQAGIALAPYFMVQNLAGGAIQRFVVPDYIKMWVDRG